MSRLRLWTFAALLLAGVTRWVECQTQTGTLAKVTEPVVGAKVGSPANLGCSSFGNPINVCLWEKNSAGGAPFVISIPTGARDDQATSVNGYTYKGAGLDRGECGLGIKYVKEDDNSKWSCTLITVTGVIYKGHVEVSILKKPGPPKFQPPTLSNFIESRPENTEINCYAPNGQPPPRFNWFLGDEPITEGLSPINITTANGQHFTYQILKRKFTWNDNGKVLKCVAIHDAFIENERKENKEISTAINFEFSPRVKDGNVNTMTVYVPEIGMRQPLSMNISANPRPTNVFWEVEGVRINEGRTSPDKRFESQQLREIAPGVYEASLIIMKVEEEDLKRAYKLTVVNQYGSGNFEILISSTSPEEGLNAAAIVGLVLGIPALLIIVAVGVVYTRSRGLLCFKGDDGTSSEKERMDGESNGGGGEEKPEPVARRLSSRLSALYENLVKKRDKTAPSDEEAANKGDKEKEADDGEKKPDDIVYAELDLARGAPEAGNPVVVRCADDKTEYAEIIGVVPQGEETNGVKDKSATPSPKK